MNERRKFNDTMRVTQWLIDDLEKKVLGDSDVAQMDVCGVADKIEEKVMQHVVALEKQKDWNSNRMRATFTRVVACLFKLRQKGVDCFLGKEALRLMETPPSAPFFMLLRLISLLFRLLY